MSLLEIKDGRWFRYTYWTPRERTYWVVSEGSHQGKLASLQRLVAGQGWFDTRQSDAITGTCRLGRYGYERCAEA